MSKITKVSISDNLLTVELRRLIIPFLPYHFMMGGFEWVYSANMFVIGEFKISNFNSYQERFI